MLRERATTSTTPALKARIGFTERSDANKALANPTRPLRDKYFSVGTDRKVVVSALAASALVAISPTGAPCSASSAAAKACHPPPIEALAVSKTVTFAFVMPAAITAD